NQPAGFFVGEFNASDQDANAILSYALVSGQGDAGNGLFSLDVNGTLRTAQSLDYEANANLAIRVRVKDEHDAPVEGMFVVTVTDLNDRPENLSVVSSLNIEENQPVGSPVGEFNAIDQDANAILVYELVSGVGDADNGLFVLETNGTLRAATTFDFESNASTYSVLVRVRDEHNDSVEGNFSVDLLDLNEDPFDLASIAILSVPENQPAGFFVGEFNASDQDANAILSYALVSGQGDAGNGFFSLESNGTLRTAEILNYESNASRSIRVRVTDDRGASVEAVFTVNIGDENDPPVNLAASAALNVTENQPVSTVVGEFSASDEDANATLTYELASGSGDADNGLFTLETNGTLKTATVFDFESNASTYSVLVRVRDEHNASVEGNFSVNLLDLNEAPYGLSHLSVLSVAENKPTASFVGEFNANDYDANSSLSYSLQEGNGSTGNAYFTLDANGTLRTAVSLNYEKNPIFSIRVRVSDEFNEYIEGNFTVEVLDLNESGLPPAFDFNATALQVEENADIGTYVGRFTPFGGDVNASVSYVLNQDAAGAYSKFYVDGNGSLRTSVPLNYEESAQWTLYVNASNDANESITNFFRVSVLDLNEAPANLVANNSLSFFESQTIGSYVGEFNAVDQDANATLTYELVNGSGDFGNGLFTLETNGTLRTATVFDFESNASSYEIRVRVRDELNASVEGNFSVNLLDLQETPYGLSSSSELSIAENQPVGSFVTAFNANDPDANATLKYYLYDGNGTPGNAYFALDLNGTLSTAAVLDYETNASHLIRVRVYDEHQAYAEGNFSVLVLDVQESVPNNPPAGLDHQVSLSVAENATVGSVVGSFTATDPDANAILWYYLYDGNGTPGNAYFTLDLNGTLRTASVLDYETNVGHLIRVRVYDEHQAYAEGNFTVAVLDVNEPEPNSLFDLNASALRVYENAPVGSYVGQFSSFGGEPNAKVRFELNPDPAGAYLKFEIDANGSLRTLVALDYEEASQWTLNVTATNDLNESASRSFVLEVINLYEAPVNYAPSDLTASAGLVVKQGDPVGSVTGGFEVLDLNDSGFHAFELVGGEGDGDNDLFSLDLNGTLRNASVLNYDQNKSLSIRVRVTDSWYFSHEESFVVSYVAVEGASVDLLSDGADVGGGWRRADWFGYYFGSFYPWVFHENLGWLYVFQASGEDTWLYHERLGWVWTNKHVFPHTYVFKRSHWVFLDRTSWPAKLFDYSYVQWFELGRKYRVSISMEPSVGGTLSGSGDYYRWDPVRIEAIPKSGYLFNGWAGDLNGNNPVMEFEAVGDINLTGSFMPDFSSAVPTAQAINALNELLESLDHLTPSERQSAMAEILIDGKSSKAGIDLRGNDR
ncbi:MAG: cadherin repeat domain-containing protein, partial [Opitutae bacterium]|nr:cadherin repeat domain-containing protein [Opitutae bacterium]